MSIEIGSIVKVYKCEPYELQNLSTVLYVITGYKNYEDYGSCSMSRDYYITPLMEVEKQKYIKENSGVKLHVSGYELPFEEVTDIAPFRFTREVVYKVERKVAKTITVYE